MRSQCKPLIEDKGYLRHFWHPVCTLAEFEKANSLRAWSNVGEIAR